MLKPLISAIKIIKENWNAIKSLTLYRYFRLVMRILSFISLTISVILMIIFMDLNNVDLTIPAVTWLFSSTLFCLPESLQSFIYIIFIKLKDFFYDFYLPLRQNKIFYLKTI